PIEVFTTRCQARASFVCLGDMDLIEAVDELQAAAVATGLVEKIGQDAVQAIMAEHFADVPKIDPVAFGELISTVEKIAATITNRRLAPAVEQVRPMIADCTRPIKERIRLLWAAAKAAARDLGSPDAVFDAFMALAAEVGLIDARGRWTGDGVRESV